MLVAFVYWILKEVGISIRPSRFYPYHRGNMLPLSIPTGESLVWKLSLDLKGCPKRQAFERGPFWLVANRLLMVSYLRSILPKNLVSSFVQEVFLRGLPIVL